MGNRSLSSRWHLWLSAARLRTRFRIRRRSKDHAPSPVRPWVCIALKQHDLYDGRFVISTNRIYQVGTLEDPPGWNHIGNDASNLREVSGTAEIDVNERDNTGTFTARMTLPEGELVLVVYKGRLVAYSLGVEVAGGLMGEI